MAGIAGDQASVTGVGSGAGLKEVRSEERNSGSGSGLESGRDEDLALAAGFGGLSLHRDIEGGGYAFPEGLAGGGSGSRGGSRGLDGGIVGLDHGLLAAGFGLYADLREIGGGVVFVMVVCGGILEGYGSDGTGECGRSGIGHEIIKDDEDGFIMNSVEIMVAISSFGFWRSDGAVNVFGWSPMWKKRKKQGEPPPFNSGRV